MSDFSSNYNKTFFKKEIARKNSLFFPHSWLYFSWSYYPIEVWNNSIYQEMFIKNARIVNYKQGLLVDKKTSNNFNWYRLFNLKNIFVFKDLKNPKPWQFDFFPVKDYVWESKKYYRELKQNKDLYIKQDNENFAQFWFKDDANYEFFLYAPSTIKRYNMEEFFSTDSSIDLRFKPINIDPESFHKPTKIDAFEIPEENMNVAIRYKKSVLQPTKIYAKFWDIDPSKPFLVQLNQTFGMSWKIKWINKKEFEEKKCIDEYKDFSITQNRYCNYKAQILDMKDTKYLNYPEVKDKNHFEWNFVGNTWLIEPDDIPKNMQNKKELYAVIIYEKQIWYNWALLISGLTFIILIFLTVFQEIKMYRKKNREEK